MVNVGLDDMTIFPTSCDVIDELENEVCIWGGRGVGTWVMGSWVFHNWFLYSQKVNDRIMIKDM